MLEAAGIPPPAFAERLERFAAQLPTGLPLAVLVSEPRYLSLDYARTLARAGWAPVFGSSPGLLPLGEQAKAVPSSADLLIYLDDPVGASYPSDEQRRAAVIELLCTGAAQRAFVLVGDRAEGSAPRTISRLLEGLGS